MEIWRVCPVADFFEVSTTGSVRSVKRKCVLKPSNNGNGYLYVTKVFGKKKKHYYVHRLVAQTFIENAENLPEVNHKDGCKQNNAVCNLEWCSSSQNKLHAYATGLQKPSERQREAARLSAQKSMPAMREGWKRWFATENGRNQHIAHAMANIEAIKEKRCADI